MTDNQDTYIATAPLWVVLLGLVIAIEIGTLPVTRAMFGGCASIMRSPPLWEGTLSLCDGFMSMEATMAVDPDASEWKLLQDYFAALSDHDPAQEQQPLDAIFDASVRRRFGDWIARSAAKSRSRKAGV